MIAGLFLIAPRSGGLTSRRQTAFDSRDCAFLALGTVLTAISFPQWGIDALRDAAIWYYALFYFIGMGLASHQGIARRAWSLVRVFWIISLIWNTADILSHNAISQSGPVLPGRGIRLFFNSTHEAGQNLALGAFIVLCTATLNRLPKLRAVMVPLALLGLAVFGASEGRGMKVGVASGVAIVFFLNLSPAGISHFNTRLLKVTAVAIPLVAIAMLAMPDRMMKVAHLDRFGEVSVSSGVDPSNMEGTAGWRMIWWQRLYEQVMARNPAFGLGFGESLAVYHPLLASIQNEFLVRSPHNFNITVFSRMGIVGLFLWLSIVFTGVGGLFRSVWHGRFMTEQYTPERKDELTFWILMLVCTVVNSSLGVLMEGPVLGIWFWFALGFASARSLSSGAELGYRSNGANFQTAMAKVRIPAPVL